MQSITYIFQTKTSYYTQHVAKSTYLRTVAIFILSSNYLFMSVVIVIFHRMLTVFFGKC